MTAAAIFRAGYYGVLVANPALAKSAAHSAWARGFDYIRDFAHPYRLFWLVPLAIALPVVYRRALAGRDRIVFAAPLVAAALHALYIARVGGDFMHARMLLPATFFAITMTWPDEKPGHQKVLPWAWILAEYADPAVDPAAFEQTHPEHVQAARRALACGELAELRAAVREPLTFGRFWANLAGAVRRTRLVIPADPLEAERALCR